MKNVIFLLIILLPFIAIAQDGFVRTLIPLDGYPERLGWLLDDATMERVEIPGVIKEIHVNIPWTRERYYALCDYWEHSYAGGRGYWECSPDSIRFKGGHAEIIIAFVFTVVYYGYLFPNFINTLIAGVKTFKELENIGANKYDDFVVRLFKDGHRLSVNSYSVRVPPRYGWYDGVFVRFEYSTFTSTFIDFMLFD